MIEELKTNIQSEGRLKEFLEEKKHSALLIGIYKSTKEKSQCIEQLEELKCLGETYGIKSFSLMAVPLKRFNSSTFIGKGKVEEVMQLTQEQKIDMVIFDDELHPHQQRNLEKILKKPVIDRTELILGVFAQRARTKEAKIQIEVALFQYQLPRLKRMWTHLERQRTGGSSAKGGYLKGMGERQIEVDKRIIRNKIASLKKDLEEIRKQRKTQRQARKKKAIPTFALIGYTNVGKSTLMNALTKADVFVEDKLFATLDTTIRKFILPNKQEVLFIDTVGFIRKIPHTLVEAFKSTLEEAVQADVLIHLIDLSSENAIKQAEATMSVLKELKAENRPLITCLNKVDICTDPKLITKLKIKHPKAIVISAIQKTGFDDFLKKIEKALSNLRVKLSLKIPQKDYAVVSKLISEGKEISCEYVGNDILLMIEVPKHLEKELLKKYQY